MKYQIYIENPENGEKKILADLQSNRFITLFYTIRKGSGSIEIGKKLRLGILDVYAIAGVASTYLTNYKLPISRIKIKGIYTPEMRENRRQSLLIRDEAMIVLRRMVEIVRKNRQGWKMILEIV